MRRQRTIWFIRKGVGCIFMALNTEIEVPVGRTTLADLFENWVRLYGCKFMRGSRSAWRASERSGLTLVPMSRKPSERSAQLPAQEITRTETPHLGCALRNAPVL